MKLLLLLTSILLLIFWSTQSQSDVVSELEVREFSWSHFRSNVAANNNLNEKGDTRSRERVFRQQMENRNSIENRSRDMRELEDSVLSESVYSKPVDIYRYKVTLKNNGTRVVKSVFWDYQVSQPDDPENPTHRQFRCAIKIKPNASESMDGLSILPPVRVISASGKSLQERVVVNRIEFTDDTVWQRPDWHVPDKLAASDKGRGRCQPL